MEVTVNLDQPDLAQFAFFNDLVARFDQVWRAPALRADLHDAVVLTRGVDHRLTLGHVNADRLLHVDIEPGFDGRDHRQGVPVVGRGDEDEIEVFFRQHLTIIAIEARRLLRLLPRGDDLARLGEHFLVDVAERDDLDGRDLDQPEQVGFAIPAGADQTHAADFFPIKLGGATLRGGRQRQARGPGLEELATVH